MTETKAYLGFAVGREKPASERQAIGRDWSAFEQRHIIQRLEGGRRFDLTKHAAERAIHDDAERAFRRVMGMQKHDGLPEMVVAQLRVRDQQSPRQVLRSAGHQRSRRMIFTPA